MLAQNNSQSKKRHLEILSVEDNPADRTLIAMMLKESAHQNHVSFVLDGSEALNYLRRHGEHRNAISPDLILLDLNLPKKTGLEVLSEIRSDSSLRDIPVLVLSTSESRDEVSKCLALDADYVTKPFNLERCAIVQEAIDRFCERVNLS